MGAPPCMVNEGKNQSQPVKLEWNSMEKTWKSTLEVYWNEWDNMGNKTQLTGLMEMIKHQMWNMSLQCNIVYRDSTFCGNKVFGCADWDRGYSLAISDYTITSQNSSVASSTPAVKKCTVYSSNSRETNHYPSFVMSQRLGTPNYVGLQENRGPHSTGSSSFAMLNWPILEYIPCSKFFWGNPIKSRHAHVLKPRFPYLLNAAVLHSATC
jgi:hypothetical protein